MTTFIMFSALLIIAALMLIIPSLLRPEQAESLSNAALTDAMEEELKALEAQLAAGEMTEVEFEASRDAAAKSLVDAIASRKAAPTKAAAPQSKGVAIAAAVFVPVLSVLMYLNLGKPELVESLPPQHAAANPGESTAASMPEIISQLETRLKAEPENAEGWYMLARSYLTQENYPKAVEALEKVYSLVGDEPSILVQYADALAMNNNGKITGKPEELLKKALELNPNQPEALWLSGIAATERGDFAASIRFWSKARQNLQEDAASVSMLDEAIADAKRRMDGGEGPVAPPSAAAAPAAEPSQPTAQTNAAGSASVSVKVSLSEEIAAKAKPGDIVFIYAKAVSGPPMPLAAVRSKVSDLPATIVLDDSQAMMPNMKMSSFPEVIVGARISLSGQPTAQPGDLEGLSQPLKTAGENEIELVIDQVKS